MLVTLLQPEENERNVRLEAQHEQTLELGGGPPDAPSPPPRRVSLSRGLVKLASDARARFYRTFGFLGVLGGIGAAAVVAGLVADNEAFWSAAAAVFFLACAALIAYAAKGLNVAAETADFLRAYARSGASEDATPTHASDTGSETSPANRDRDWFIERAPPRQLTNSEEAWLYASVHRRGSHAEKPTPREVHWIWHYLRRTDPPREPDEREWLRRHLEPAQPDAEPPSAEALAWLIREVSVDEDRISASECSEWEAPPGWNEEDSGPK
jgi:hypothetical protein